MKYYTEEAERFKESLFKVLKEYDQQNSLNMCELSRDLTIEFKEEPSVLNHIADICKNICAIWNEKVWASSGYSNFLPLPHYRSNTS
jgi:hypothetical protein